MENLKERVVFNGKRYTRHTNAKRADNAKYFMRHTRINGKLKTIYLHRDVWEFHNGPIPKGGVIHHKDGNTLNNGIKNLELTTARLHALEHLSEKLPLMNKGVTTPEHRAKISAWMKKVWGKRQLKLVRCILCGDDFKSRVKARYCPQRCRGLRASTRDKRLRGMK